MNDNDFDEDGNNIVPCPICMDVHCPNNDNTCHDCNRKLDGENCIAGGVHNKPRKCPKEDEFVRYLDLRRLQEEACVQFDQKSNYVGSEFVDGEDHPLNKTKVNKFLSEYIYKAYILGRTHENAKLKGEIQNMDKVCCPDVYSQPENDELILQSELISLLEKSNQEIKQHD